MMRMTRLCAETVRAGEWFLLSLLDLLSAELSRRGAN